MVQQRLYRLWSLIHTPHLPGFTPKLGRTGRNIVLRMFEEKSEGGQLGCGEQGAGAVWMEHWAQEDQWPWVLWLWISDLGLASPGRPGQQGCESKCRGSQSLHSLWNLQPCWSLGQLTWTAPHVEAPSAHQPWGGMEAEVSSRRLSPGRHPRARVLLLIQPWEHPLHKYTVTTNTRGSHNSWNCRERVHISPIT